MNIYFAGSIRGGRDDAALYAKLINHLQQYGTVLTEHVGHASLQAMGEGGLDDSGIHNRDMDWLNQSGLVVAEVTTPSLGVGYEIGCAVTLQKPVLALYRPQEGYRLSAMIGGSKGVQVARYHTLVEGCTAIDRYMKTH